MRALLINALYPTPDQPKIVGGAEVFVRDLAEGLVAAGDTVEVIRCALGGEAPVELHNGVVVSAAKVHNIYAPFTERPNAARRLLWHFIDDWRRASSFVEAQIKRFRPDVIHTHTLTGLTTGVWTAARAHKIPIVHTLHDYYLTCPRSLRFARGRSCAKTCADCRALTLRRRRACAAPAAVVGVSRRVLDIHDELGLFRTTPIKKVIRLASPTIEATALRSQLTAPLVVGFIGRIAEEKGVERLARAVALLPQGAVRLTLAGRVEKRVEQRLKQLAPGVDMSFLGFVDPRTFFEAVDIVAVPSIWEEPAGLVISEALAARRPVLGTRYGGIPEAVSDGKTGWLTTGEPQDIAAVLARLIAEPAQISEASRRCLLASGERPFSKVVEEYRDLYVRIQAMSEAPGDASGF